MKAHIGLFVYLFLLLCLPLTSIAKLPGTIHSDSSVVMRFRIFYPVNETKLHEDYMDNANQLHRILKHLEKSPQIDSITIYSYASPEGPYALNKRLAAERGKTAKEYLLKHFPTERHLSDSLIIINPTAENWQGLRDKVYYQYPYDEMEDVLALLDRTDISDERRKVLLKRLNYGKPWVYILKNIMPELRYATWVSVWKRIQVDQVVEAPADLRVDFPKMTQPVLRTIPLPPPVMEEEKDTFSLAVKTNLLYDAITALNVEIEVPVGNHWSVMVEDVFPWWETGNKYCLQLWEMGVEGRYWFSNNRWHSQKLNGHFVGAYVMSGKYDLQWDYDLCYQGEFWSTGLTYGYTKPIGKYFNLEFSLSLGYLSTGYCHYLPSPDYSELVKDPYKQGRLGYFGPTKIKVSLVFPVNIQWSKKRGGSLR